VTPGVLCTEHRELYDAICAGDTELAASLAYVHVERGRRPSLERCGEYYPVVRTRSRTRASVAAMRRVTDVHRMA
jgi:hypothetical protein